MTKATIQLIIFGITAIAALVFFLQNLSPALALVIFGSETIALPISAWLILSAILGFLTSIILQFLLGLDVRKKRRPREWDQEEEEREFPETEADRNERFTEQNSPNQQKRAQSETSEPPPDSSAREEEDWESPPQREDWNQIDDDWDIEQPPKRDPFAQRRASNFYEEEEETPPRRESTSYYRYRGDPNPQSNYYQRDRVKRATEYRIQSEETQDDTYNQEEDNEEEERKSPPIYEANYRVIRPPLWNLPQEDNEKDDNER